jgi:general secretion pathway protein D
MAHRHLHRISGIRTFKVAALALAALVAGDSVLTAQQTPPSPTLPPLVPPSLPQPARPGQSVVPPIQPGAAAQPIQPQPIRPQPVQPPGTIPRAPGQPVPGVTPMPAVPGAPPAALQPSPPATITPGNLPTGALETGTGADRLILLNFRDSPLDQVLEFVADLLGRTLLKSPGINATITLKSQTRLTVKESLQAIESVLSMNNVSLVPMGEKFLKVVQTASARQEAMAIGLQPPVEPFAEADQLVSQVITLKHIEIGEAQPIMQSFLHGYGKIQALERANSLLVTDTAANINRILEILEFIDQPAEAKMETRIYEIRYAEAAKIAAKLNELIADSQAQEEKPRVAVPQPLIPTPPGIIRPRPPGTPEPAAEAGAAEKGLIRGKVKIIADDRTNILFVISRGENFTFFDKIVLVLDRPVDPEITAKVVALEYAKAEDIAGILNEFIGAASAEQPTGAPGGAPAPGADQAAAARSKALEDFIARRAQQRPTEGQPAQEGVFGRLSQDTKILADKRTNALLLMGRKSDLDQILQIIESLDIMLAQVLIETAIIEVNLGKTLSYGVDWLQRSVTAYQEQQVGPRGGLTVREPIYSFGGGSTMGGDPNFQPGHSISYDNVPLSAGSLTYYLTFYDLNVDAVLHMAASSRDARIVATPVVLTTDNTEAKIVVAESRPIVTSSSTFDTGTQTQNFQYQDIGIELTVTPRINPQRFVVMELKQSANNVAGFEIIDGNRVPIITKRELQAQIAINSRNTIVLGGMVGTDRSKDRNKVPFLGDIPVLGIFFRSDSISDRRTEIIVLITPYVMQTPTELREETVRLHSSSRAADKSLPSGWSDSELNRMTKKDVQQILKERATVETPPPSVREVFPRKGNEPAAPPAGAKTPETFSKPLSEIPAAPAAPPEAEPAQPAPQIQPTAPAPASPVSPAAVAPPVAVPAQPAAIPEPVPAPAPANEAGPVDLNLSAPVPR